jgi:hypothetical protein
MNYEIYYDAEAGWTWLAKDNGRVITISTNHSSEFAARINLDYFKRAME